MTHHEYVFIAISVVLGLALTRLLHTAAGLIRAYERVSFHWATALWGVSIMLFILQFWWVGWELRTVADWTIIDFFVLIIGSIFVYGAADLALPAEDYDISSDTELVFLAHSQSFGRLSALAMLGYFCVGPYVNITMFGNSPLLSFLVPAIGAGLMLLIALKPARFETLAVVFAAYTVLILYVTA